MTRMPMILQNDSYKMVQFLNSRSINTVAQRPRMINRPSALNTSMIGRIYAIKPGCGSCGRR